MSNEPLGCTEECGVEVFLASGVDVVRLPEVDLIGGHKADAGVVVVLVVPGEEPSAERTGVIDGFKPFWEFRLIFQGLELGFRERVVSLLLARRGTYAVGYGI